MKREAGLASLFAVAIAAVGISSSIGGRSGEHPPLTGTSAQSSGVAQEKQGKPKGSDLDDGPCKDIEERLRNFLDVHEAQESAPSTCYNDKRRAQTQFSEAAQSVRIVIATAPDPLHTHLSLVFDREMDSIQQAASDEGYLYDSSWLPWKTEESSYALLDNEDTEEKRKQDREDQPGILLFRNSLQDRASSPRNPFASGLIVFVVGEETTGGIHRKQFTNAVAWANALQPEGPDTGNELSILGPFASGSIPSLGALLTDPDIRDGLRRAATPKLTVEPQPKLLIYSGFVSSFPAVEWLKDTAKSTLGRGEFKSFQFPDNCTLRGVEDYLGNIGIPLSHLAVLSEDETAYGNFSRSESEVQAGDCDLEGSDQEHPVRLFYPRDISALRSAYQEQALFGLTDSPGADTQHRTLRNNVADPEGKEHDTIKTYSGGQQALSQEGSMQQIVGMLHSHQSQFILIRSSNPLDVLFLAHYFRVAYPEGRVVASSGDVLLQREAGLSGLTGIMYVGDYPPLASLDDWMDMKLKHQNQAPPQSQAPTHSHRVFAQSSVEGNYVALRFLLDDRTQFANDSRTFSPPSVGMDDSSVQPDIRHYSQPFWLTSADSREPREPRIWLTVLGRDGFYPVASYKAQFHYNRETLPCLGQACNLTELSRFTYESLHFLGSSIAKLPLALRRFAIGFPELDRENAFRWPPVPLSLRVIAFGLFALSVFHAYLCAQASLMLRPEHRCYFVRVEVAGSQVEPNGIRSLLQLLSLPNNMHLLLVCLASVCLSSAATSIAIGYGWTYGQPMPTNWDLICFHLFPYAIWIMSGFALASNAWIEHSLAVPQTPKSIREIIWPPLALYLAASLAWFLLVFFCLDYQLSDANRIPTYLRSMQLTSGVSPTIPLISLALGFYIWCWCSLRSVALLGTDRPLLPPEEKLVLEGDGEPMKLSMISDEKAGQPIDRMCEPLSMEFFLKVAVFVLILACANFALFHGTPIHSLGSHYYTGLTLTFAAVCIAVLTENAWQLVHIWIRLRILLVFLDRLPLRRTLQAMGGFSWGSIWNIGGNVIETRDKLTYRQFECLNHLSSSLKTLKPQEMNVRLRAECLRRIDDSDKVRMAFVRWYSDKWDKRTARSTGELEALQKDLASLAATILIKLLIPRWRQEQDSLLMNPVWSIKPEADGEFNGGAKPSLPAWVQSAEEAVCLVFLGFIQNVIGRMRSIIVGVIAIFLSLVMLVSSYPFNPRPLLNGVLVVLFLGLGATISTVYAQMFRDPALSHLTNTKPGELGLEFWIKLFSIGIGPVLGLLTVLFPQVGGSVLSWLQPSISAMK